MLFRKISTHIEENLKNDNGKILCIYGARQVGKSFIIRNCAKKFYKNYVEVNLADDFNGDKLFENANTKEKFYIQLSLFAGNKLGNRNNTIIFLDEIQIYPHILTLLKDLNKDNKYKYICSGSELGITLKKAVLSPMGTVECLEMFPLDFEEFLIANSVGVDAINYIKNCFVNNEDVEISFHNKVLDLFKRYLLVGGLPDPVNIFIKEKNIYKVREFHKQIVEYYSGDAARYDDINNLKIKTIYKMVPSNIENKVRRINYTEIDNKKGARFDKYKDEFDYLISSGIVLDAKAISEPKFPLIQSSSKNLIKLYMNDVGLLTSILYRNNENALLKDEHGLNLGAVYETVAAMELKSHGHNLFYFDRRKLGEVDYLIDDYDNLTIMPIEIKSGSDESNYRALPKLVNVPSYRIKRSYVLSNKNAVEVFGPIIHAPIYFIMFM